MLYLESNGIISECQFGFRRGRSVEDQLLLAYDDITQWVNDGFIVDLILFDFSKAFDVVSHSVLMTKLRSIGIKDEFLDWIHTFVTGRYMSVIVSGSSGSLRSIKSGVPQRWVLGPVLFLIFINFIVNGISCKYKIFADDLKIYLKVCRSSLLHTFSDLVGAQRDINLLNSTGKSWGLCMNIQKCVTIRFQHGSRVDWDSLWAYSPYYLDNEPYQICEKSCRFGCHN